MFSIACSYNTFCCLIRANNSKSYTSYSLRTKPTKETTNYPRIMESLRHLVDEKPLVIFSRSNCCMCHSMKQLVRSYGANATVYELDLEPNGDDIEEALQDIGSGPSIPAVFIGQRFVGGAKEIISLQVQGKLVPLLKDAGAIWM